LVTDHARRLFRANLAALGRALLVGVFLLVVARTAWVSDDAFITFRTIDNFLNGYGLRWNVAERVQSYTHPLWLILLTPVVALSGNPFLSALGLSVVLTIGTVAMVLTAGRGQPWFTAFALPAMTLSRSFVDYSTSGLENALSHALLAVLMLATATSIVDTRRAALAGALVALTGMTRFDLLLLSGPIALSALTFRVRILGAFAAGLIPLACWELFSIVYYGVPFPNTAYAKLATAIPRNELVLQGAIYLFDALQRDPITLFCITAGLLSGFSARWSGAIVAAALSGYMMYVVTIGGDFMSGRFFSAPFLVALMLLARTPWPKSLPGRLVPLAAAAVLGLSVERPTVLSDGSYQTSWREIISPTGIADERGFYFQSMGWWTTEGPRSWPGNAALLEEKINLVKQVHPQAFPLGAVGLVGYQTGPSRHIIDVFALNDPLLARLPAQRPWRIGHFARTLPAGYMESVVQDQNLVEDPEIAALYEVIREVTRGPLWSARRWRAIMALNAGRTGGWTDVRD
jgi:arabinofuranosyltransferase